MNMIEYKDTCGHKNKLDILCSIVINANLTDLSITSKKQNWVVATGYDFNVYDMFSASGKRILSYPKENIVNITIYSSRCWAHLIKIECDDIEIETLLVDNVLRILNNMNIEVESININPRLDRHPFATTETVPEEHGVTWGPITKLFETGNYW